MNQYTKDIIEQMLDLKEQNTRLQEKLDQLEAMLNAKEESEIEQSEKWGESTVRNLVEMEDIRRICAFEMPMDHVLRIKKLEQGDIETEDSDEKK